MILLSLLITITNRTLYVDSVSGTTLYELCLLICVNPIPIFLMKQPRPRKVKPLHDDMSVLWNALYLWGIWLFSSSWLFCLFLGSSQLFFKNHVGFRSVCSSGAILEVGGAHAFGLHIPGPHMGVFPLFPTEGFTAPWNSQKYHIALLQEDGCGERDGQGDLPEIPGEESREVAGGLCRGLGHSRLPLSAEAQRQPGRGEPEAQPFPSDEPCLWAGFIRGSLRSLYQSLHREVISYSRAIFGCKQQCLLELTAADSRDPEDALDHTLRCNGSPSAFSEPALFLVLSVGPFSFPPSSWSGDIAMFIYMS